MKNISTIVNSIATAKFAWVLAILFSLNATQSWGQYLVDFEGATKTSYASGNVTLNGVSWNMTEALIGSLSGDKKNGARSMRMRRNGTTPGTATMLADKTGGVGTISFQYARYGTETGQASLFVEYSINGGSSWTQAGTTITSFPENLTLWTATINQTGNVRIRFRTDTGGTNQRRFNIDDIQITDFIVAATPTITLSESSITNLNYNLNYGPATNQTFTAQGADLTANINLSAPPNFEISTNSTTGFASSLTLTPTAGTVNPTTIYTRLAANLGVGIYTGTLSATSSGASAQNITLNGKVLPTLTSIGVAYTEDFSSYSSAATVPSGWSVVSSGGVNGYDPS